MSNQKRSYRLKARAESQQQTRQRIVRATMDLHRQVGPARTTVAEIARRANVQRLTVYNHFPDDAELFAACQADWMALHPFPDLSSALAEDDPIERVRAVLLASYRWYRETGEMAENVQRDRSAVPVLDRLLEETFDAQLSDLSGVLAAGFAGRGRSAQRRGALIRLALDFWTWRRLDLQGLGDRAAADLMAATVACA